MPPIHKDGAAYDVAAPRLGGNSSEMKLITIRLFEDLQTNNAQCVNLSRAGSYSKGVGMKSPWTFVTKHVGSSAPIVLAVYEPWPSQQG